MMPLEVMKVVERCQEIAEGGADGCTPHMKALLVYQLRAALRRIEPQIAAKTPEVRAALATKEAGRS